LNLGLDFLPGSVTTIHSSALTPTPQRIQIAFSMPSSLTSTTVRNANLLSWH
jgi:hypothetical protein